MKSHWIMTGSHKFMTVAVTRTTGQYFTNIIARVIAFWLESVFCWEGFAFSIEYWHGWIVILWSLLYFSTLAVKQIRFVGKLDPSPAALAISSVCHLPKSVFGYLNDFIIQRLKPVLFFCIPGTCQIAGVHRHSLLLWHPCTWWNFRYEMWGTDVRQ